jgi:hypothetical protein
LGQYKTGRRNFGGDNFDDLELDKKIIAALKWLKGQ